MKNITNQHPFQLHDGEEVYEMESGRRFTLLRIRDEDISHQGKESFWLIATLLDADGHPAKRRDGSLARDPLGHAVTHHAHDGSIDVALQHATDFYLSCQDNAAKAHDDIAAIPMVSRSQAPYLPQHVQPPKKDVYGKIIN